MSPWHRSSPKWGEKSEIDEKERDFKLALSSLQHRSLFSECILIRADNGFQFHTVEEQELSLDGTVGVIVVSEALAIRLLKNRDLWRRIPSRTVKDDQGRQHICEYVIKVSYRWSNDNSTRDAKIYVSSQSTLATVHLLVPIALDTPEPATSPVVQPTYHLPPQTKDERDRQRKNDEASQRIHADNMSAAQQKKERKFEDAYKKPGQDTKSRNVSS